LKGFSKNEIDDFTWQDLEAIDKAIARINQEQALPIFLAQDYNILKNAQPTDNKGNPNIIEKMKYQDKALKLFETITGCKEPKKQVQELSPEEEQQILTEMKQTMPKYQHR